MYMYWDGSIEGLRYKHSNNPINRHIGQPLVLSPVQIGVHGENSTISFQPNSPHHSKVLSWHGLSWVWGELLWI